MGYRNSAKEDYEFEVIKDRRGGYDVHLPHQCDEFKILGFELNSPEDSNGIDCVGDYPACPTDHAFAVQQMELFVKRAQEALEKLRALR